MVPCPNCGIDNPESRLFCAVCGTQLREEEPPPPDPTPPLPASATSVFPEWLTAPTSQTPSGDAPKKSALPSWLQGAEVDLPPPPIQKAEPAPVADPTPPPAQLPPTVGVPLDSLQARTRVDLPSTPTPKAEPPPTKSRSTILPTPTGKADTWDDRLDFSDLPDWEMEEEAPADSVAADTHREPPMGSVETQGLLAGVAGAIPIEPIIQQSRRAPPPAPPMNAEPLTAASDEAVALFSQIAGGAVQPEPITIPRSAAVGSGVLHLLLLLAVLGGLALKATGWELFNPPTPAPHTQAYAASLSALPRNGAVLVAVEYDGAVLDELNPTVIATLNQIRTIAPEGRVMVVSSSPVGVTLVSEAWNDSVEAVGGKTEWESLGYVTGGATGQRATLARHPADVMVVVAGDSTAAQRWIEQNTAVAPDRPLLAIVPASAEVMMRPYLASGQVDGAIASITDSAAYELSQQDEDGRAWQRLDTVTLAALVVVLAMVVGVVRK
jgi:hypothetical protein